MNKILVIPHHPVSNTTKIRLGEIAKFLAEDNEVFLLNWSAVEKKYTLINRIACALKDAFKMRRIYKWEKLTVVETAILHRPIKLAPYFNYFWLKGFIEKTSIDIVINGSFYMFRFPDKRSFKYVVDLADLPEGETKNAAKNDVMANDIRNADAVTVISHSLGDYIQKKYSRTTKVVPNGFDQHKMKNVSENNVAKGRDKYGLKGKWVIGYIGFIGGWVNVELVIKAFKKIKQEIPNAFLVFIGAAPDIKSLEKNYSSDNIVFTGGIAGDIEPYFKALDVGLMPHKVCSFQDMAFHLKIIEYTAAFKFIVSNKLKETQRLNFPNIIFTSESVEDWVDALRQAKEKKWDRNWDKLPDDYDWRNIVKNLCVFMEKLRKDKIE